MAGEHIQLNEEIRGHLHLVEIFPAFEVVADPVEEHHCAPLDVPLGLASEVPHVEVLELPEGQGALLLELHDSGLLLGIIGEQDRPESDPPGVDQLGVAPDSHPPVQEKLVPFGPLAPVQVVILVQVELMLVLFVDQVSQHDAVLEGGHRHALVVDPEPVAAGVGYRLVGGSQSEGHHCS